jgi:hypothetical protein
MTQMERETGWVTEDEESGVPGTDILNKRPEIAEERSSGILREWRNVFRQLTRVGIRGSKKPRVGQVCLVMKGRAGEDEGQMAVVTGSRKVMVEIAWKGETAGLPIRKLKHPQSLVMLEEGLVLEQMADGVVWIRRTRQGDTGR